MKRNSHLSGLDKKDIQNVADGRIYGGRGLGFVYRFFNGLCIINSLSAAVYFLLINENSPLETIKSTIPLEIQQAPAWLYYLFIVLISLSLALTAIISRILNSRSREIVDIWSKTGKVMNKPIDKKAGLKTNGTAATKK